MRLEIKFSIILVNSWNEAQNKINLIKGVSCKIDSKYVFEDKIYIYIFMTRLFSCLGVFRVYIFNARFWYSDYLEYILVKVPGRRA